MPQGLKPRPKPPEQGWEPSLPVFICPALKRPGHSKGDHLGGDCVDARSCGAMMRSRAVSFDSLRLSFGHRTASAGRLQARRKRFWPNLCAKCLLSTILRIFPVNCRPILATFHQFLSRLCQTTLTTSMITRLRSMKTMAWPIETRYLPMATWARRM